MFKVDSGYWSRGFGLEPSLMSVSLVLSYSRVVCKPIKAGVHVKAV